MNPISGALGPTADCPALDDLIVRLEGKRGEAVRNQTESHLKGCSYCRNELAMFREFESPEARPEEQAHVRHIAARLKRQSPVERTPWWSPLWNVKVWAPAAVAMVAAGLMISVWTPVQRDAGPDVSGETFRSARVEVIGPTGEIRESPREFQWKPAAGAVSYTVKLFEVDNTELWSAAVSEPKAELPALIRGKLAAPKALNWRVTAISASGMTIADSGMQRFSIVR